MTSFTNFPHFNRAKKSSDSIFSSISLYFSDTIRCFNSILNRARQTVAKYLTICFPLHSTFILYLPIDKRFYYHLKQKKTVMAQFDANKSKSIIHHYVFLAVFLIHLRWILNIPLEFNIWISNHISEKYDFFLFIFRFCARRNNFFRQKNFDINQRQQ